MESDATDRHDGKSASRPGQQVYRTSESLGSDPRDGCPAAVAGPIGEALVSTAAGLFVAIPAVLAYNFLNRGKKTLSQDMDAFAHDLHVRLLNQKD